MSTATRTVKPTTIMNYPEPDARLARGRVTDLMRFMGPGLILASASIGSGEVFFSSRGGATFGYTMIWAFLLSVVLKGMAVYSGARYMVLTGEHPANRWALLIPGPRGWFPALLGIFATISFPTWGAGFAKFLGQWTAWVTGVGATPRGELWWATMWMAIVLIFNFIRSYDFVEKVQTWIVILLLAMCVIAVFVSKPDILGILRGFIPTIPGGHEAWIVSKYPNIAARPISLEVITYLGALGGGTYDYIGFLGIYREKRWGMLGNPNLPAIETRLNALKHNEILEIGHTPEETAKAKHWLRAANADNLASFASVFIFSICFMILGVTVLRSAQIIPNDSQIMQNQARFLTNVWQPLLYLYMAGIWAAFFGSMQACSTQLYVWTFKESLSPAFKVIKNMTYDVAHWIVVFLYLGVGTLIMWTGFSFTNLVSFGSILGGVLSLGLWALAMVYTEAKIIPKHLHMNPFAKILTIVSGIALTIMGVIALWQYIDQFI